MEQGREVTLNEFADCTPEEYRKAHQPKTGISSNAENQEQKRQRLKREQEEKDRRLERLRREQEEEASRANSRRVTEGRRNVHVAQKPTPGGEQDEAAAIAEVEKLALEKAEAAAKRVAEARKKRGGRAATKKVDEVQLGKDREESIERNQTGRQNPEQEDERLRKFREDSERARTAEKRKREEAIARARAEARRVAEAKAEAKRVEEERLREQWQNSRTVGANFKAGGSQQQPSDAFIRGKEVVGKGGGASDGPKIVPDTAQPVVKPPQSREQRTFPQPPSFTSHPNAKESTDERFLNEEAWQAQRPNGPSRFQSNIMKLRKESDPSFSPPFRDRDPSRGAPRGPPEDSEGFMVLESEEALIEAFEDMASFGGESYGSRGVLDPEDTDPSGEAIYEEPYFMDVPENEEDIGDKESMYPNPGVSPPFPVQESYSDSWSSSDSAPKNFEPKVNHPSRMGMPSNGNTWSSSYDDDPPSRGSGIPFGRGGSMNQGASYLDNLSNPSEMSRPRMNYGSSYLNELSNQQQHPAPDERPEFPDRIQEAYRDWCEYYGKSYDVIRLRIFAANFLAVEKYHRETGVSLILNELADMTADEYQQRNMD